MSRKVVNRAEIEDPNEREIRVEFTDGSETYLDWPARSWRELLMFVKRGEIDLRRLAQKLLNDPHGDPMREASLRSSLIRLAKGLPKGADKTALLDVLAIRLPHEGDDNSYGAGNYPLPAKLHHLGNFADVFRAPIDHKVFPGADGDTHMLTVPVSTKLSIMGADLMSLLRLMGLSRIQVNKPGTISFYFLADASEPAPLG